MRRNASQANSYFQAETAEERGLNEMPVQTLQPPTSRLAHEYAHVKAPPIFISEHNLSRGMQEMPLISLFLF